MYGNHPQKIENLASDEGAEEVATESATRPFLISFTDAVLICGVFGAKISKAKIIGIWSNIYCRGCSRVIVRIDFVCKARLNPNLPKVTILNSPLSKYAKSSLKGHFKNVSPSSQIKSRPCTLRNSFDSSHLLQNLPKLHYVPLTTLLRSA